MFVTLIQQGHALSSLPFETEMTSNKNMRQMNANRNGFVGAFFDKV